MPVIPRIHYKKDTVMRRKLIPPLLILSVLLAGCSLFDGQFVRVTPHKLQSSETQTEAYTANGYESLRDVLKSMAADGRENGVIYTEGYDYEALDRIMRVAIDSVRGSDPIGAYAIENMDYQIGTNNGRTAVAVDITFRHDRRDIQSMARVENMDEAKELVLQVLGNCDPRVVMMISSFQETDFTQLVWDLAQLNPQIVMETPQVTEGVYGEGNCRVVELSFAYENSRDTLRQMQNQVRPIFDAASLYVSGDGSDHQKLSQLYAFVMERFDYKTETSITPAYSLLRHGVGDSRAFATVYAAMCRKAGLECMTVTGTRWGESWTWNIVCDGEKYYHVDLLRCSAAGDFREFQDSSMTGYVWDYSAYPECSDTAQVLPVETEPPDE